MGSRSRRSSSPEARERRPERDRRRRRDSEDEDRRRRRRSRSRSRDKSSRERHRPRSPGRSGEAPRRKERRSRSRERHRDGPRVKQEARSTSSPPDRRGHRTREAVDSREPAFGTGANREPKREPGAAGGVLGEVEEKQGPNFEVSGKLLEDTNVFNGVVIKYSEPPEARKCKKRWRLYVFKGDESLATLHMHRQSAYLIGKDRKVADVPVDHPSCSRQHAAFQYRAIKGRGVLPYVMDLGSSNGTYLNNDRIEPQRYYELREKDMLKFGYSSREYVLLHDQSKDDEGGDSSGEEGGGK